MAKSSRASSIKANNRALKSKVFGPAEDARAQRLSARLMEIAKQPKPESSDANMDAEVEPESPQANAEDENEMELDSKPTRANIGKKRIDKRKQKKSGIVFSKYSDRQKKKQQKKPKTTEE